MTEVNIYKRIVAIMGDLSYIQKGKKEVSMGPQLYRFVSHDQVASAVHPLLVKHGVAVIPTVEEIKQDTNRTSVKLAVAFVNTDNPNDHIITHHYGYGIDGGDKGPGKAISYAYKYALLKTFCLETGDDPDKDQESIHEPVKCQEFDSLLIDMSEEDVAKVQAFIKDKAKTLGKHPEELKSEAMKRPSDFLSAVKRWKTKA